MPPQQCPECARFLSADFVTASADEPAACPKCEVLLTAVAGVPVVVGAEPTEVHDTPPDTAGTDAGTDAADTEAAPDAPAEGRDPLAGWDEGPEPAADDTSVDLEAIAPYAAAGLLLGLLLGVRGRRVAGGLVGAILGAVVGFLSGDR